MKAFGVLLIVGGILLPIGASLLFAAVTPSSLTETPTLPAGAGWFLFWEIPILGSGTLFFEWAVTGGGRVNAFVFDQAEYDYYVNVGYPSSGFQAFNLSSSSVQDMALPRSGTYYAVIEHGTGSEGSDQSVRVTIRVNGIHPTFLTFGVALASAAAAFLTIGAVLRKRQLRVAGPPAVPPSTNVVMFEQQNKP